MRHVVVTRFSVPRLDAASAARHADPAWLDGRLVYFRRYYLPGMAKLGIPAVLLCSSESAEYVRGRLGDLGFVSVVVQNSWYGGWQGDPDEMVTRLDSDDAVHERWFERLEAAAGDAEVLCSRSVLRLDVARGRLYSLTRREPSPLAAFAGGANPFAYDHKHLEKHYAVRCFAEPYLLQVVHGGNLSSRAPAWWRLHRRMPLTALAPFGLDTATALPGSAG